MAEKQVRVAVIMDDTSYIAGGANVVSTNTKIATSSEDLAAITKKTADAQVAAILKVREASKLRIANLQGIAANAPNLETQTAASVALQREQAKLARTYGETTFASRGFSNATKTAEVDANKLARGVLAGSGALSVLGRSLAFASSGFIAFAVGATVIKQSIKAAQDEAVAQRQVAAQLKTSGKSWKEYGTQIDSALLKESHLAGFTKADLLQAFGYLVRIGGNVQKSLTLTGLAADVARARTISLQSASIALAKALGGSATALRRLGIIVPKNVSTTQALAFVTAKFAGQAAAGTTASEKFHATLVDTGAAIGTVLLPTFNRLATSLSNWLAKMNESGNLTKNVNAIVSDAGAIFHTLGTAIHYVDDVTGSFKNTLEDLIAIGFARLALGWTVALRGLAVQWGLVAEAATAAGGAQQRALAAPAASGLAAGEGAAAGAGARTAVAGLSTANIVAIAAVVATVILNSKPYKDTQNQTKRDLGPLGFLASNIKDLGKNFVQATRNMNTAFGAFLGQDQGGPGLPVPPGGPNLRLPLRNGGSLPFLPSFRPGGPRTGPRPFGTAQPIPIYKTFTDTIGNQLAQARAALTKSTADDVAAAKREIAFIKKEIAAGHLQGASLIQALNAEAGAVSTIQSAEAAAAQKAAARAQALKAKIAAQIQNSIDPLKLEVQLSRDQADNAKRAKIIHDLKALRAAARKALASGDLSLAQQKQAYDQITQLNAQLAALHKKQATAAKNQYHQVNQAKFLGGLDLTPAQRKALRQRLAQLGPGGTTGSDNVGAYGYQIGKNDRPIHVHTQVNVDGRKVAQSTTKHQQRRRRRNSSQRRGPTAGSNG